VAFPATGLFIRRRSGFTPDLAWLKDLSGVKPYLRFGRSHTEARSISVAKFISRVFWFCSIAAVGGLFVLTQKAWIERATYVTHLAGGPDLKQIQLKVSEGALEFDGTRSLVIPEHNESSYHWLMQSQHAAIEGRWILGTVDYDNAPVGRSLRAPSLYRWWLTLIARLDRYFFGSGYAASFDRAALIADPLLIIVGAIGLLVLVFRMLGAIAAWVLATGVFSIFPFASAFLPAAPDTRGLVALLVLSSTVLVLIGLRRSGEKSADNSGLGRTVNGYLMASGVLSALVAWIHLTVGIALVTATCAGALAARIWSGPELWRKAGLTRAWRSWGISGSATSVLVYLFDYLPRGGDFFQLDRVHPLYALAWIGGVELLVAQSWRSPEAARAGGVRRWVLALVAGAPLVALGWILIRGIGQGPEKDLLWAKLTNLPGGPVAANSWVWLKRDGLSAMVSATLLPLTILASGSWGLWRSGIDASSRSVFCVLLATAAVFLAFAVRQLGAWSNLDATVLALAVASVSRENSNRWFDRVVVSGAVAAASVIGLFMLRQREPVGPNMAITAAETTQLVERDLARWLSDRFGEKEVTVFAPPRETTALCYFGDFRGIGTFAPENRAGFGTALSIVGAASMEEVEALVHARGIRCIVLPTWDPFLEDFARLYLSENYSKRSSLLVRELRSWNLPLWLRPMAYQMPSIPGFEKQNVAVFEVVEPQTPALAASRTAECLAELGDLSRAQQISENLRRFPGDIGALASRVNVAVARGDTATLEETARILKTRVQTGADRYLAWDRRVSLAVALAQTDALDLAKEQVGRCLIEADEKKVRALSIGSLYRLLVLAKSFELHFSEPKLRELAERLLPADVRAQL